MQLDEQTQMRLAQAHKQAENEIFEGKGGAGMVVVCMNGLYRVVEVRVDEKVFIAKNSNMLARQITQAVNAATEAVTRAFANRVQGDGEALGIGGDILDVLGES